MPKRTKNNQQESSEASDDSSRSSEGKFDLERATQWAQIFNVLILGVATLVLTLAALEFNRTSRSSEIVLETFDALTSEDESRAFRALQLLQAIPDDKTSAMAFEMASAVAHPGAVRFLQEYGLYADQGTRQSVYKSLARSSVPRWNEEYEAVKDRIQDSIFVATNRHLDTKSGSFTNRPPNVPHGLTWGRSAPSGDDLSFVEASAEDLTANEISGNSDKRCQNYIVYIPDRHKTVDVAVRQAIQARLRLNLAEEKWLVFSWPTQHQAEYLNPWNARGVMRDTLAMVGALGRTLKSLGPDKNPEKANGCKRSIDVIAVGIGAYMFKNLFNSSVWEPRHLFKESKEGEYRKPYNRLVLVRPNISETTFDSLYAKLEEDFERVAVIFDPLDKATAWFRSITKMPPALGVNGPECTECIEGALQSLNGRAYVGKPAKIEKLDRTAEVGIRVFEVIIKNDLANL